MAIFSAVKVEMTAQLANIPNALLERNDEVSQLRHQLRNECSQLVRSRHQVMNKSVQVSQSLPVLGALLGEVYLVPNRTGYL